MKNTERCKLLKLSVDRVVMLELIMLWILLVQILVALISTACIQVYFHTAIDDLSNKRVESKIAKKITPTNKMGNMLNSTFNDKRVFN